MADLKPGLRRVMDRLLSIPGRLGLRHYKVEVLTRTWTGDRPGLGSATDTVLLLALEDGYAPNLEQLSQKDIINSGNLYQNKDLNIVHPKDYDFESVMGGFSRTDIDPATDNTTRQTWYKITNYVDSTASTVDYVEYYDKVQTDSSSNFTIKIVLRKSSKQP